MSESFLPLRLRTSGLSFPKKVRKSSAKVDPSLTNSGRASNVATTTSAIWSPTVSVRRPIFSKKWSPVTAITTRQELPLWKCQSTMPQRIIASVACSGITYPACRWISLMGNECYWTREILTWSGIRSRKTIRQITNGGRIRSTGPITKEAALIDPALKVLHSMARCDLVQTVAFQRYLSVLRQKERHLTRKIPNIMVMEQDYK